MKRFFPLCVLTLFVNGCTSPKLIPVKSSERDSIYIYRMLRDSIYARDSIYIVERGDTVFKTTTKYVYKDRVRRDTIYIERRDTVTNVVEVERELSRMERLKMDVGSGVLWAIPILIALYILYRKFKK